MTEEKKDTKAEEKKSSGESKETKPKAKPEREYIALRLFSHVDPDDETYRALVRDKSALHGAIAMTVKLPEKGKVPQYQRTIKASDIVKE